MCTTSAECKTVIIVVLMVISGMDPHMISEIKDLVWLSLGLGFVEVGLLGCGSVTVRLCDVIDFVTLRWCGCYLFTRLIKVYVLTTAFYKLNQSLAILVIQPSCHIFLHLLSSNHKSTQTCIYRCFRLSQMLESKSRVPAGRKEGS
jgi:hypothetical protein